MKSRMTRSTGKAKTFRTFSNKGSKRLLNYFLGVQDRR